MEEGLNRDRSRMKTIFNENWDGIRRKGLDEANSQYKRNPMQAATNYIGHIRTNAPSLYSQIKGRTVFILLVSWSASAGSTPTSMPANPSARDDGWHGFCPLDNGKVMVIVSNFSSRHNYALWGRVSYAEMKKEDARMAYIRFRESKEFEWEGQLKA